MLTPRQLQAAYHQGENISRLMREERTSAQNTEEIIEVSYDLQSGSYVSALQNPAFARHKRQYSAQIAREILALCHPDSLLEAGVGEATTLAGVLESLGLPNLYSFGFDISWSRVAVARSWLRSHGFHKTTLCTGSLFHIPLAENSVDVVYTSHTIEPNGGKERPILEELYRVARKYLLLLEPGYELAGEDERQRMERHGYCRGLKGTAQDLGYRVLDHRLFPYCANPLNPTALTIIEKNAENPGGYFLACPRYKTALRQVGQVMVSAEALCVYPVLDNIPCLRPENGIIASKYEELVGVARVRRIPEGE